MGKHDQGRRKAQKDTNHAHINRHGGPQTGDGRGSFAERKPKGIVFRSADGKPAVPPKAGSASRLRTIKDIFFK